MKEPKKTPAKKLVTRKRDSKNKKEPVKKGVLFLFKGVWNIGTQ